MTEKIDKKEWLIREVYARYGLAMYFAQCVERGLAILLTALEIGRKMKTRSDYDLLLDRNFENTLGRLIKLLEKEMKVDYELKDELEEMLKLRNYLAHNFFWQHGINFMEENGCQLMLSELESIIFKLENANKTIISFTSVIRKRYGVTDEKINKIQEELLSKYYL